MNRLFQILLFGLCACSVRAQTLQIVEEHGPRSKRINLVFLSEGYTTADLPNFAGHVSAAIDYLFSREPWKQYRTYCNVYRIEVASNQSGTDNGSAGGMRDTYFGSGFYNSNVSQLLTFSNTGAAYNVLNALVPEYTMALLLVNDVKYGGAGGSIPTASTHPASAYVVEHELGHSFAGLADEYDDEYVGYNPYEAPNATAQTTRNLIKWNHWIEPTTPLPTPETTTYTNLVGIFEGAVYRASGWYRPHDQSLMRYLQRPCGDVNREQFVLRYYSHVNPVDSFTPTNAITRSVTGLEKLQFSVENKAPETGSPLTVTWKIDGQVQTSSTGNASMIFDLSTPWRYLVPAGNVAPAGWNTAAFQEDGSWNTGNAFIGLESNNASLPAPGMGLPATPPNSANQCVVYLRKTFQYNGGNADSATVTIDQVVDDGVTYYLNGVHLGSVRHVPGTVLAAAAVPPNGDAIGVEIGAVTKVGNTGLVEGTNVICAELHQVAVTSSDAVFGARMTVSHGAVFSVESDLIGDGSHSVSATVQDTTAFVRKDSSGLLTETISWPLILSNQLPKTLANWRSRFGDDLAVTSDDGLSNLMKYALALDPPIAALPTQFPQPAISAGATQYLTLTVPRRIKRSDIKYVVEVSSDLVNWNSGAGHTVTLVDESTRLVVRDEMQLAVGAKRFMRLKVRDN